jgi:hypothetical protein
MFRLAFALSAVVLVAAPASAATYSAKLAVPASERFIARDIVWDCGPAACQGATEESRPVVLCQSLAKQGGRIDSFVVNGREFTAAELIQCNTMAAKSAAPKLASQ